jgi:hypothetical protein
VYPSEHSSISNFFPTLRKRAPLLHITLLTLGFIF